MQTASRETTEAVGQSEPSITLARHSIWIAVAAATAGAWLGMAISVLGWFDEPLVVWFQVSLVATSVGACGGLVIAAVVIAARLHHRHANQERVRIAEYDASSHHS